MKQEIRKQVIAARDAMSPGDREMYSRRIGEQLFALPEFTAARCVLFFASFRSEVETAAMIRRSLASGKRVILPKVAGRELSLFGIRDFDRDVAPGTWGIPEPRESPPARIEDVDFIVVPGAAFDEQGNRIGYGAGYYDKLLQSFPGEKVALAFESQIVPRIVPDPHDIPVTKIITEKRIIEAVRHQA